MAAKQWGAAGSLETQPHVKWESVPDSALIVSGAASGILLSFRSDCFRREHQTCASTFTCAVIHVGLGEPGAPGTCSLRSCYGSLAGHRLLGSPSTASEIEQQSPPVFTEVSPYNVISFYPPPGRRGLLSSPPFMPEA